MQHGRLHWFLCHKERVVLGDLQSQVGQSIVTTVSVQEGDIARLQPLTWELYGANVVVEGDPTLPHFCHDDAATLDGLPSPLVHAHLCQELGVEPVQRPPEIRYHAKPNPKPKCRDHRRVDDDTQQPPLHDFKLL